MFGQIFSTYTFSPLRVTDSGGQCSCQVRIIGSTTINTSKEVTINVMCELDTYLQDIFLVKTSYYYIALPFNHLQLQISIATVNIQLFRTKLYCFIVEGRHGTKPAPLRFKTLEGKINMDNHFGKDSQSLSPLIYRYKVWLMHLCLELIHNHKKIRSKVP